MIPIVFSYDEITVAMSVFVSIVFLMSSLDWKLNVAMSWGRTDGSLPTGSISTSLSHSSSSVQRKDNGSWSTRQHAILPMHQITDTKVNWPIRKLTYSEDRCKLLRSFHFICVKHVLLTWKLQAVIRKYDDKCTTLDSLARQLHFRWVNDSVSWYTDELTCYQDNWSVPLQTIRTRAKAKTGKGHLRIMQAVGRDEND